MYFYYMKRISLHLLIKLLLNSNYNYYLLNNYYYFVLINFKLFN